MKILKIDKKLGFVQLVPHSLDDLWAVRKFLKQGDIVFGTTVRSIKPKKAVRAEKKKLFLEVEVEKAEFHEYSGELRVSGIIVGGKPEDLVELKAHHTIEIVPGQRVGVKKKELKDFELGILREAEKQSKKPFIAVVLLDEREAEIAVFSNTGFVQKAKLFAKCSGKQYKQEQKESFFPEILDKLERIGLEEVLVAGPGFAKEKLKEFLGENSGLKVFAEQCSHTGRTGFAELAKKGVPLKAFQESILLEEEAMVEELVKMLGKKPELVCYGFGECKEALEAGAVKQLMVSEKRLLEERGKVEQLIELAENSGAKFHIFGSKGETGNTLEAYSGFVGLLRYSL